MSAAIRDEGKTATCTLRVAARTRAGPSAHGRGCWFLTAADDDDD